MSLLEALLGLALGLLVLAAVLGQDAASSRSARLLAAQAQMADDAQIALQLLTSELVMAGFAQPQSIDRADDGQLHWRTALTEPALLACETGFAAPSTAGPLGCASRGQSAAFAVRYQADADNTVPLSGSSTASDCLGHGLKAEDGVYLTENRWFVASSGERSELRCASRLGNPGQPLVDNVEAMALWLGQALPADPRQVVRYLRPSQVDDWARVRSVRLCLLLHSSEALLVPADDASYWDCQGQKQLSPDGRLRRAFHASVALRGHGSP
jgi:type IV pilus assembly protein PilW